MVESWLVVAAIAIAVVGHGFFWGMDDGRARWRVGWGSLIVAGPLATPAFLAAAN